MTIVTTITKNVIHRAWTDLEPKLIAFLATGLTATALVAAAAYVGIPIPDGLASLIVLIVSGIAGYIKSSTTKITPTAPPAAPLGYVVNNFTGAPPAEVTPADATATALPPTGV